MATDAITSTLAAAVTAGTIRTGDLNFAQGAAGLVSQDGTQARFLNNNGQNVNADGTLNTGGVQALTAAGAVNLTTRTTSVATSGAIALTLADGTSGQEKIIGMITDGGDATLTPAHLQGGTTLTFNDVGDTVHLVFLGTKWSIIANNGATLA